jgi:hypothetical protein
MVKQALLHRKSAVTTVLGKAPLTNPLRAHVAAADGLTDHGGAGNRNAKAHRKTRNPFREQHAEANPRIHFSTPTGDKRNTSRDVSENRQSVSQKTRQGQSNPHLPPTGQNKHNRTNVI